MHSIEVVIDRFKVRADIQQRLADSIEPALKMSDGIARVAFIDDPEREELVFSAKFACPICGYSLTELEPRLFSFNNPAGACPTCYGLGVKQFFDPARIVVDGNLSLAGGAIRGWDRRTLYYFHMLQSLARHYGFDIETPFAKLSRTIQQRILYGSGDEEIEFTYLNERGGKVRRTHTFEGIIPNMERRYRETESNMVREELAKYLSHQPCPDCEGTRLRIEARNVFLAGRNLPAVTAMSSERAYNFFHDLVLPGWRGEIAAKIRKEVCERLNFLNNVGLEYLTLDRSADTLSGGEAQRIRLASQIGAGLVGVMYVLDEPSIGLHQRDNQRLLDTLKHLRDLGNTVIVVEHDEDAIRAADHVLDMGPGAEIVGLEQFDKVINIDQSPIGRTPRSNPATYTGVFTPIRELFAGTQEARARGYGPGRFSFNVKGGRCEACEGDGVLKVEMHFLPDVYVPCDVCKGKRYNRETLALRYKGKTIFEVLDMTIEDARVFFDAVPMVRNKLQTLVDVGLSYIRLGQNATTLSGGEAQSVKMTRELSKRGTGSTLYILDEPTTGLHFHDIQQLLDVLHRLRDQGNTIVVIEHNLDVIKTADWLIDLGPEGGEKGGELLIVGTPEEVVMHLPSYTGRYLRPLLEPQSVTPKKRSAQ